MSEIAIGTLHPYGPAVARPATREDVDSVCGDVPVTVRALAIVADGKARGIVGMQYVRGSVPLFFSAHGPEVAGNAFAFSRVGREALRLYGSDLTFAVADPEEPRSPRFLEHLGFKPLNDSPMGTIWVRRKEAA